jgi:hypothetical protein
VEVTPQAAAADGYVFYVVNDLYQGLRAVSRVVRADGKQLSIKNAWTSKYKDSSLNWHHFLNIFDSGNAAGHAYTVYFNEKAALNRPPELVLPEAMEVAPGRGVTFNVSASDPDQQKPELTLENLPAGATFTEAITNGGNTVEKVFSWTAPDLPGTFFLNFTASDGLLSTSQALPLSVSWEALSDYENWKRLRGISEDDADSDGDGYTALSEYGLVMAHDNPNDPNQPFLGVVKEADDQGVEQTYLTLNWVQRVGDPAVVVEVFGSSDPGQLGEPLARLAEPVGEPLEEGAQRFTMRDDISLAAAGGRRFLTIRVSLNPVPGES